MTLLRDEDLAAAFDHAAHRYDALVAANPGHHAHLRRSVRRLGPPRGGEGLRVLDLGCGTGAPTAASTAAPTAAPAAALPGARITAVGASGGMPERAAAKPWPAAVTFAQEPARAGVRGPSDAVSAARLPRNVSDPDAVLATVHGLLTPGGRLGVHEYALGGRRADRAVVWTLVCRGIVRPAATVLGDGGLYRHLWRSVVEFGTAGRFADRLRATGFEAARALPLPGWRTGITHTFVGRRPGTAAGGGR